MRTGMRGGRRIGGSRCAQRVCRVMYDTRPRSLLSSLCAMLRRMCPILQREQNTASSTGVARLRHTRCRICPRGTPVACALRKEAFDITFSTLAAASAAHDVPRLEVQYRCCILITPLGSLHHLRSLVHSSRHLPRILLIVVFSHRLCSLDCVQVLLNQTELCPLEA